MRKEKVKKKTEELVKNGEKPSASRLVRELDFSEPDIHRCLNVLEKQGEIETYTREVLGRKHRMVGVNR